MCTKPLQIRPRQGVHATSNRGARRLALSPLVCPDTLWAAPVSRSCCGFTDCVEGSPLPSTQCARGAFFALVTRLSATFRETARPGGGRVCRLRCVACALLRSAGLPRLCRLACLGDGGIPQDDFAGISRQCFCLTRGYSAACLLPVGLRLALGCVTQDGGRGYPRRTLEALRRLLLAL